MFARRGKKRRAGNEPFTYVHEGTTFRGDLQASGRVRVHGTVLGSIAVAGVLEVAPEGVVRGERIEAEQIRILGVVEAPIVASGKVEIWSGGRLMGDVEAASLDIEEGASFTGRSVMRPHAPAQLTDGSEREDDPEPAVQEAQPAAASASGPDTDEGDREERAAMPAATRPAEQGA